MSTETSTLPQGFAAAGINCGVRHGRPDLGIILSQKQSVAAVVSTRNTLKAAPVRYCESILPRSDLQALITNSGQANAATGLQGDVDNRKVVEAVAQCLRCNTEQVAIASTGVIGERLAVKNIINAIPDLIEQATTTVEPFAAAILTTDLVPKVVAKTVALSQGQVNITGICKGSGMIHPNMATMLGYLLTDARLTISQAQALLNEVTNESFNMISVDGETSTNDSVFLLANGASEVAVFSEKDFAVFKQALLEVTITLAKSIVRDGEGATKLIEVQVSGATDKKLACRVARSVTISPLVKTAVHGASPNWGRIMARLGAERISADVLAKCSITMQGHKVFSHGAQCAVDGHALKNDLRQDTVTISIDLADGFAKATAWGCDLSAKYVDINAEYVS